MWGVETFEELVRIANDAHQGKDISSDSIWRKIGFDGNHPRLGWAVRYTPDQIKDWAMPLLPLVKGAKSYIFVGMGGSINTVKMVRDFLNLDNIYTIDSPDRGVIMELMENFKTSGVNLDEILIIAISKSATTFETHAIASILKEIYSQQGIDINNHIIWLIDKVNKEKLAQKGWDIEKVKVFSIQVDDKTDIGGRFTCPKTAVFLLPVLIHFKGDLDAMISQVNRVLERDPSGMCLVMTEERVDKIVNEVTAYPQIELIVPSIFEKAFESFRVWVNQLYQESLGGKVEGFDPKIIPVTPSEYIDDKELDRLVSKKRLVWIDISGLGIINRDVETDLDVLMNVVLLLEYMVAMIAYRYSLLIGPPLNFVNQPNVQLYKKRMQEIEKIEPQPIKNIKGIIQSITEVLKEKDGIDFLEVVYYGPDDSLYSKLKETAKQIARSQDLIELVFRGPDWNHHAFQAAPTCRHTLFLILTDERASDSVKLISQATYEVLREKGVAHIYSWISSDFVE